MRWPWDPPLRIVAGKQQKLGWRPGLGSACRWVLSVFPWYPSLCAHKDPGDLGQFQWVWGLQAPSPGLSRKLPPVPSEQATSCCLPHCPPFIPLADGKRGRCAQPARADGHEAGDPAPQGPPAARLSLCSAPLSGPVLPSLQVLQSARGRCSWAIKPRGQAVRGRSCLPAEKQETHLRGKVEEQLPWAPRYRSGGLALAGAWTKISPGLYWRPFSSLGEPSTLSSPGWVAAHTKASVGEGKRPGEGKADHREGNRGLWA